MLRPLIIDDRARAKIAAVLHHAAEHHYRPGPGVHAPGYDEHFVARLGTYRCVFTYTHSDRGIWRHLTVSVPSNKFPNPAACFVIATEFGFTGWDGKTIDRAPDDWLLNVNDEEHCVVLAQAIGTSPDSLSS